jgi:predicted NBD/HSP70 family sugar kinase
MYQAEGGEGYVVNPTTSFPGWHKIPLATWLRERLGMPVVLENNATAAAVGERWYGAGRRIGTFFYLFFGFGLGGAVVIDGRPYEGSTGNAGELGYLPPTLAGGEDGAHVGTHFSLPRLYDALRADGVDARTPEDLDRLLAEGHPRAAAWLETAADHLTGLVLAVEYLIDPEAIVFGGRLPDRMLEELMARVARRLPGRRVAEKASAPRHLLATAGRDAAALGVATLPIYQLFAPGPQVLLKQGKRRAAAGLGARGAAAT